MKNTTTTPDLNQFKNSDILAFSAIVCGDWFVCVLDNGQTSQIFELKTYELASLDDFFKGYSGFAAIWNSKEMYKVFRQQKLTFPKNILDLELAAYLEDSQRKIDLAGLIKAKFGVEIKTQLENTNQSEDIFDDTPQIDTESLQTTTVQLYKLARFYFDSFSPDIKQLWIDIESPLAIVLAKMELAGVYINKGKLRQTGQELSAKAADLEREILGLLDSDKINLNSPTQLGEALIKKGFDLNKKGASGKLSVDKSVLELLSQDDQTGLIQKILEYRSLTKLLSTYTENLISLLDSRDRLHCQFNQAQAATGRISSNSPNLQNIPIRNQEYGGQIRSCFEAPAGRLMISSDYSQIELRLLAHYTNDPVLIEAFSLNQDIHRRTAAEIFDIPLDQVTSEQRSLGKTLNFALLYQQGAFATSRQLGITTAEAKKFIEKYFTAFATVKPFIEQVLDQARKNGYSQSISGRRRYFKFLNSPNKILAREDERAAFNMVLQGSNADLIKIAMIQIDKKIVEQKLDAIMMLQVHDELVFEVSEKDCKQLADIIRDTMSNPPIPLNVNISVDTKVGTNWAEC